ncbi:MAG TPA: ferredoxin reductase, partial [Pseudolabrys sp.]
MTVNEQPPAMPLCVTRNDKIADGIHLFEFRDAGGKPLPEFSAGAHIAIQVPGGLLRKYSLCNDPTERNRYLVAVKREANGRGGSSNLIDKVKAGDTLMVAAPVNDFGLPPRAQDFLFIAGGIGITPIMAMIREVHAQGKRFRLFYCTRSPETTAFRDELSA